MLAMSFASRQHHPTRETEGVIKEREGFAQFFFWAESANDALRKGAAFRRGIIFYEWIKEFASTIGNYVRMIIDTFSCEGDPRT